MPDRIHVYVLNQKDRSNLLLQWIDSETGLRRSCTAGTADPDRAEQKRADKEYELNHGLHAEPARMSWGDFADLYQEEQLAGRRTSTQAKWRYVSDRFQEEMAPRNLGQVTERMLSRYQTKLRADGRKPATIHGHLAYLRAALRWAGRQRLLPQAPTIEMPKLPKKTIIRKTDQAGYRLLLAAAPDDAWRSFISTAWHTGMRRNELLDLHWEKGEAPWIDFDRKRIWIPAAYNKADTDQWLPLHPELAKVLKKRRQPEGKLFALSESPREVSRKFTKLAKKAGVDITLHDLRRSFGSRYAPVVEAPVLKRLMRHADIRTTLDFYTDVDDVLEEAILKA